MRVRLVENLPSVDKNKTHGLHTTREHSTPDSLVLTSRIHDDHSTVGSLTDGGGSGERLTEDLNRSTTFGPSRRGRSRVGGEGRTTKMEGYKIWWVRTGRTKETGPTLG